MHGVGRVNFDYIQLIKKPVKPNIAFHIETSHLFCIIKQTTGFYMNHNTGLKWVNAVLLLTFNMLQIVNMLQLVADFQLIFKCFRP